MNLEAILSKKAALAEQHVSECLVRLLQLWVV